MDKTPPPLPLPVRLSSNFEVTCSVMRPDYAKFHYRAQARGADDCRKREDDGVVTTSVTLLPHAQTTWEVCVTAEDEVGNLSSPQVLVAGSP